MSEDLAEKIELMKKEIDGLQIAITSRTKPWYQDMSTIIAVVALLFSFGTTYVSYQRAEVQDIQSTRQELRGLLQRLAALPKENLEATKKYKDDPFAISLIGSFINEENSLLAKQAAELAKKLPKDTVSPTEYFAIAVALQNAYNMEGEKEFLVRSKEAAQASKDFNTEIAVLRTSANLQFIGGQPQAGRVDYQKALDIFSEYPNYDPFTKASTDVQTELAWASSEAGMGSRSNVAQHIQDAETILSNVPPSPGANMLRSQVDQAKAQLAPGGPMSNPIVGSLLPSVPVQTTHPQP
jgi:hypothetical protein